MRVNALCPGFFPLNKTARFFELATRTADIMQQTPMARFGKPEELVGAALPLAAVAHGRQLYYGASVLRRRRVYGDAAVGLCATSSRVVILLLRRAG